MKRKNPEFAKARRFIRKAKFSENLSSASYLYIKLFVLWFLVVISDFLIEFRFEYLWAFYLCVRNVYDIFKYQGFAFSALFVFITLTSNAIWFFLMPVQWLFFTASTYVWFQYIWNNSEKGICLQTFIVWLIFVYVEATVRLKDLKNMPSHLDLCRPMAAQCIGYPFVTLGFGFKKYLNYKITLRRQKEVQAENELTFATINRLHQLEHLNGDGSPLVAAANHQSSNHPQNDSQSEPAADEPAAAVVDEQLLLEQEQPSDDERAIADAAEHADAPSSNVVLILENIFILTTTYLNAIFRRFLNLTTLGGQFGALVSLRSPRAAKSPERSSSIEPHSSSIQDNNNSSCVSDADSAREQAGCPSQCLSTRECNHLAAGQLVAGQQSASAPADADATLRLDKLKKMKQENKNEIKKLKAELAAVRQSEADYKEKLSKLTVSRNEFKFQCSKLQHDNTMLQEKMAGQANSKHQDKTMINELEKKLQEERKARQQIEKQMSKYSRVVECGEACKQKRLEYEDCIHKLREQLNTKDAQLSRVSEEAFGNKALLLSAIEKLQARNAILEGNLREETKLKLDLFSVLGDTRRQLEVNQIVLMQKTNEVEELSCKLSELMAVIPNADPYSASFLPNFINQRVNHQTVNTAGDPTVSSSSTLNHLKQSASSPDAFQQSSVLKRSNNSLESAGNLSALTSNLGANRNSALNSALNSNLNNNNLSSSLSGNLNSHLNSTLNSNLSSNLNSISNSSSNNASTNSNKLSASLTASSTSSGSTKDGSLDWKSLSHSLESTSGVKHSPKNSTSDL